ncbi:Reverse transcriptase domain [Trinorchestia longiramus]|nr:Reverse transcriptase domain [Trinorchestia longiramus]
MRTNFLQQHVNEPTRGNNILDLVMMITNLSINGYEITDKIGDHQMTSRSKEVNRLDDRTKAVDLVYLDFEKASDKVPHERLMAKVEAHGIRGNYSRWIRNWLTDRTQHMVIHDKKSYPTLVTSGVLQGSILGPLLFIIYINHFGVGISSDMNKFSDDTKIYHRAFTERNRATIQSDLNRLLQWTETWQMSFNTNKCTVMHVGAKTYISNSQCMTYLLKQSSNKEI